LEKEPIQIDLNQPEVMNNPIAPFTTTTFEALMPFLTSRFGKNIPAELHLKIKHIEDI
jgi:hypothetical protein